jgi:hypothetical protein
MYVDNDWGELGLSNNHIGRDKCALVLLLNDQSVLVARCGQYVIDVHERVDDIVHTLYPFGFDEPVYCNQLVDNNPQDCALIKAIWDQ